MLTLVAFVVVQLRVDCAPAATLAGVAVNAVTCGALGCGFGFGSGPGTGLGSRTPPHAVRNNVNAKTEMRRRGR
jgi:hypothetical protein